MSKKTLLLVSGLVLGMVVAVFSPTLALADVRFNMMSGDQNTLTFKNETQGTSQWQDSVSANGGDYIKINVYYHCGNDGPNIPPVQAGDTKIRLTFPIADQSAINVGAQITANNVTSASDTGSVSVSSSQHLIFDSSAKWYRENNQVQSDIPVTIGQGYAQVSLGEIGCDSLNCYTGAGYLVFRARLTSTAGPTVDLKANGSDGSITIDYNTAATLSWTSTNATSCYGSDTAWQGTKWTSGSESTGSLLSSRTYILTCTGPGGTASDNVTVLVNSPQSLYVILEAIPGSGNAPLLGVDLRATVTGTAAGTINYKFDCTSDGTWDYTFLGILDNPKTVAGACSFNSPGNYLAKVQAERGQASPAQATTYIVVGQQPGPAVSDLSVAKTARNLSDNTGFAEIVASDPGEVIEFKIVVSATGNSAVPNVTVKDTLPDNISFYQNLKIDGVLSGEDIRSGVNIGTLNSQQTKTITFEAVVGSADKFVYGQTDLTDTALAFNTTIAKTDTAIVRVTRSEVKGATDVPTGVLDNAKLAFILSLAATMVLSYFLLLRFYFSKRAYEWGVSGAVSSVRKKAQHLLPKDSQAKSEQRLAKAIEKIRMKEGN